GEKFVSAPLYDFVDPAQNGGYNHQWGDLNGWYAGWGWDTVRFGRLQPRQDDGSLNYAGVPVAGGTQLTVDFFGSAHPGGFQVVLCDGSVRVISYGIDNTVMKAVCNRKDGVAIDPTKF